VCPRPYETLAHVYEWLIPDELLTPTASAAAFAPLLDALERPARILDCAAGGGQLAVGLAAMGFSVVATDASPAMIERTRALTAEHRTELTALTCKWEELPAQHFEPFDAVLCVGNSIAHAAGHSGRQAALAAIAGVLCDNGLFVVTSRNWEAVRSHGSRIDLDDRTTERRGRPALPVRAWIIPDGWDDPHYLDVAVAFLDDLPAVSTTSERLTFWPFPHQTLERELQAVGLTPSTSTYSPHAERYLITAYKMPKSRAPKRGVTPTDPQ
jgi:SAM-dependent methyltransferase